MHYRLCSAPTAELRVDCTFPRLEISLHYDYVLVKDVFNDQHIDLKRLSRRRVSISDGENSQNFRQQCSMPVVVTVSDVSEVVRGKLLQQIIVKQFL